MNPSQPSASQTPIGILGWTGLVGQTLFQQLVAKGVCPSSIATYNSKNPKNLTEIRGAVFETLYICCMPSAKWWANIHADEDEATLNAVLEILAHVQADSVFLISTVDVLKSGSEHSDDWTDHPYGRNRRSLETWVQSQWPTTSHILRLPALFGKGLKKNALYDLIHNSNIWAINLNAEFQWYNLANLLDDSETCRKYNMRLAHLVSPPIVMRNIVKTWFPELWEELEEYCEKRLVGLVTIRYNLSTEHCVTSDGSYWSAQSVILREMGAWIAWEKWRISHTIAASNIGFTMSDDVASVLHHAGITALEITPTKGTDFADFQPVSMQSLLYGIPIQNIFRSKHVTLVHMRNLMASAAAKGIRTFVFGSPKQRNLGDVSWLEAMELFRNVGDLGAEYGITVCMEPNAAGYGCTWLTTVAETLRFVEALQHPNIRLSLDSGNYAMERDTTPLENIPIEFVGHLQISAAHLGPYMSAEERDVAIRMVDTLWRRKYTGAISYEAREPETFKEYCRGLWQFMDVLECVHNRLIHNPDM